MDGVSRTYFSGIHAIEVNAGAEMLEQESGVIIRQSWHQIVAVNESDAREIVLCD